VKAILFIISSFLFFSSIKAQFTFDWNKIKTDPKPPKLEARYLLDSLTESARTEVSQIVSRLSAPAVIQLIPSYFYLDGSIEKISIKTYVESFFVRPPDGEAGYIRVAYLAAKFHKSQLQIAKDNEAFYPSTFKNNPLKVPSYNAKNINSKIKIEF
jgi:hypothetical protein